jgi:hypothetical protein
MMTQSEEFTSMAEIDEHSDAEALAVEPPEVDLQEAYYSPSTNGFYHPVIHGQAMPADVVEISKDKHRALLLANAGGKVIQPGEGGRPVAVDPPPPSISDLAARRDALLRESHWRIAEDEPDREAWLAYRKQLRELDLKKPVWPTPPAA